MDVQSNPLHDNFQVEKVQPKERNNWQRKLRNVFRWEQVVILLLLASIGALQLNLMENYRGGLGRPYLWIFPALALTAFGLVLLCLARSVQYAFCGKKSAPNTTMKSNHTQKRNSYTYEVFNMKGKYFLIKFCVLEVLDMVQQLYCVLQIHLCTIPVNVTVLIQAVFVCSIAIKYFTAKNLVNTTIRNRIMFLDLIMDSSFAWFPVFYQWYILKVPIVLESAIVRVAYPTLFMIYLLFFLWENYFMIAQNRDSETKAGNVELKQVDVYFPKRFRHIYTTINAAFAICYVTLCVVHLASQPSSRQCATALTEEIWNGCNAPVPFCSNALVPKCDCAAMRIKNYSQQELPDSFHSLNALLLFDISSGQLETLPHEFGNNHRRLVHLAIVDNRLESVPDSTGSLVYLGFLWLPYNRLSYIPDTIGNLKRLYFLSISNNQLETLPTAVGELKNLIFLLANNNNISTLPESVGTLPILQFLSLQDNRIERLPEAIGGLISLQVLSVAHNSLISLPSTLRRMQKLKYLQISHNRLKSLPEDIGDCSSLLRVQGSNNRMQGIPTSITNAAYLNVIDLRFNEVLTLPPFLNSLKKLQYFYAHGNPICNKSSIPDFLHNVNGGCAQQCSLDCPSVFRLENTHKECNDGDYTYELSHVLERGDDIMPVPNKGCNTASCKFHDSNCNKR